MRRGVQAHHLGGQRGAQQRLALRLQHGGQQPLQLARVGAVEDAGLRQLDAAHAQRRQRAAHQRALRMAAHQHGDVAGASGRSSSVIVAALRRRPAAARSRRRRPGGARRLASACAAAAGRRRRAAASTAAARRAAAAPRRLEQRWLAACRRAHRVVVQPVQHEGLRVGAEQRVQRMRAARAVERWLWPACIRPARSRARLQVGVQVGIAEAVDRLLRVAHQEQRRAAAARRARGRWRTAAGRCPGTRRSARPESAARSACASAAPPSPVSRCVQVEQHVVEADHALLALGLAQCVGPCVDQLAQQPQALQRQPPAPGVHVRRAAAAPARRRDAARSGACPSCGYQRAGVKQVELVPGSAAAAVGTARPAVASQRADGSCQRLGVVGALVQPGQGLGDAARTMASRCASQQLRAPRRRRRRCGPDRAARWRRRPRASSQRAQRLARRRCSSAARRSGVSLCSQQVARPALAAARARRRGGARSRAAAAGRSSPSSASSSAASGMPARTARRPAPAGRSRGW